MKYSFLFLFVTSQLICYCYPLIRGNMYVQLISYENPGSKKDDGTSCDAWFSSIIRDICDVFFKICVTNVDKVPTTSCDMGLFSTLSNIFKNVQRIRFGDSIGFLSNPYRISLWEVPKFAGLTVNVMDDDGLTGHELMSRLVRVIELPVLGRSLNEVEDAAALEQIRPITLSSLYSELVLRVWVHCTDNHYGPGCATFCRPGESRESGFYACDRVTGQKHCLYGWTGKECRQPDLCLTNNPCLGSSTCFMNASEAQCDCPNNLSGPHCETAKQPCRDRPCLNGGVCVADPERQKDEDWRCECPHHFRGRRCQDDVNECAAKPNVCYNGGTCINIRGGHHCNCINDHWGASCEKPPVYSVLPLKWVAQSVVKTTSDRTVLDRLMVGLLITVLLLVCLVGLAFVIRRIQKRKGLDQQVAVARSNSSIYSECQYEDSKPMETEGDKKGNQLMNENEYEYESRQQQPPAREFVEAKESFV